MNYEYPWGAEKPDKQLCWNNRTSTCPVQMFRDGDSRDGLSDLSGNVSEWLATPDVKPGTFAVRGGTYLAEYPAQVAVDVHGFGEADERLPYRGFRCATSTYVKRKSVALR